MGKVRLDFHMEPFGIRVLAEDHSAFKGTGVRARFEVKTDGRVPGPST